MNKCTQRSFSGSEAILYDTVMVDTRSTFVKIHGTYKAKSEPTIDFSQ